MRRSVVVACCLAASATVTAEGLYKEGSAVRSLVASSEVPSDDAKDQPFMLVEFYSAWCGHCQHFAPTYEEVAKEARTRFPDLVVAAVNCVDHADICSEHHIGSYPTLVLYPGAKEHTKGSSRSKDALLKWVGEEHVSSSGAAGGAASSASPPPAVTASTAELGAAPEPTGDAVAKAAAKVVSPAEAHATEATAGHATAGHGIAREATARAAATSEAAAKAAATGAQTQLETAKVATASAKHAGEPSPKNASHAPAAALSPHAKAAAGAPIAHVPFDAHNIYHPASDAAMLTLRPMPRPVPVDDVLAAARYTLYHDVYAALSIAPSQAYARPRLGALRGWLHLLHRALPRGRDGGVAATSASELLLSLHGRTDLPSPSEWTDMLSRSGASAWPKAWVACNSSHAELHAYPCSLWLLFHSLLAHATEPDALPYLHAIVGYVTNFFSCKDCVGHFALLAAALEQDLRAMAAETHHGRDRAALWLWQSHNKVNERLADEALTDTSASSFVEFAKVQWPSRSLCPECREVSRPQPGAKAQVHWRHDAVLKIIYQHFCLEPRFECWAELARMEDGGRSPTEVSAVFGTYGIAAGGVLLLLFACRWVVVDKGTAPCGNGGTTRRKTDHVV